MKIPFDRNKDVGISSLHELFLPLHEFFLPLHEQIQHIFSSKFDRNTRYDQVSATLASSIEKLPSPLKEDATEQTKKMMALAKKLLNTETTSFDDIIDFQTLAQVTLSGYSEETPSFTERMNTPRSPWMATPDSWVQFLLNQGRIHCALRVFNSIQTTNIETKSAAGQLIALFYAKQGETQKALAFLQNIPYHGYHERVYNAILDVYFEELQYDKIQELIDRNCLLSLCYLKIGDFFLAEKELQRALDMRHLIPEEHRSDFLYELILAMRKHDDDEWKNRGHSLAEADSTPAMRQRIRDHFTNHNTAEIVQLTPQSLLSRPRYNLKTSEGVIGFFNHLEREHPNNSYAVNKEIKKITSIESIAKDLFENRDVERLFNHMRQNAIRDTQSPFSVLCKHLLQLCCEAGRFNEAIVFSDQLADPLRIHHDTKDIRRISILCDCYRWDLQHAENSHALPLFIAPLSESLIEALVTGRYAEVVTLLKESLPDATVAKKWFFNIFCFLRYSTSPESVLLAVHFLDCIPDEWKNGETDIIYQIYLPLS